MNPLPRLYKIRLEGHLGATALSAFPTMVPQREGRETVLTGLLEDRAALFGLLGEIEALGLEITELRRVVPPPNRRDQVMTAHPSFREGSSPHPPTPGS
jgi:hypothetical protein